MPAEEADGRLRPWTKEALSRYAGGASCKRGRAHRRVPRLVPGERRDHDGDRDSGSPPDASGPSTALGSDSMKDPLRVLVAGGGVAALEATLALRELAEDRVSVELIA